MGIFSFRFSILFFFLVFKEFKSSNQSPCHAMLRFRAFHMTLLTPILCSSSSWQYKEWADGTLSRLGAILWLVLNNVTNGKPCRTFSGITQKKKVENFEILLEIVFFTLLLWHQVLHFFKSGFPVWSCLKFVL